MRRPLHIAATVIMALQLLLLGLGTAACGDDSCYDNGSSLPLAKFYVGTSQQSVSGLTIMGIGAPGDSLLADSTSLSEVYLPLRANVSSTAFAITRWIPVDTLRIPVRDTLTIDYDAVPYFHSAECGAMFNFNLNDVRTTLHGIDSVVPLVDVITNSTAPALRIYFTDFSQ